MQSEMNFGLASREDFPAILELQDKNLFDKLTPDQRTNGYLTVEFSGEMLEEVIKDLAIVKAFTSTELVGYRMAQTLEFNARFPLLSAIIARFPTLTFKGQKLSDAGVFISGPTCIAEGWRGQGIHEGMFKKMLSIIQNRFDVGVTFVAKNNPRSLAAAQNKLGMSIVDDLTFNGKEYSVLAFSTKIETQQLD